MAVAAIFASMRRRRSPCLEAFIAPVDLGDVALVQALACLSRELISGFTGKSLRFQRKNSRSLLRKVKFFCVLLEYLNDGGAELPSTAVLCFKELYLLFYRSKVLLDYFTTIPKDFCSPISLELIRDPVIISTGQTYDRNSISRWMEEGHCNCPKTGQMLSHTHLVPNRALRNLIVQWCTARG